MTCINTEYYNTVWKHARLIRGNSPYVRGGEMRKKDTRKHKKLEVGKQKERGCFTDANNASRVYIKVKMHEKIHHKVAQYINCVSFVTRPPG